MSVLHPELRASLLQLIAIEGKYRELHDRVTDWNKVPDFPSPVPELGEVLRERNACIRRLVVLAETLILEDEPTVG